MNPLPFAGSYFMLLSGLGWMTRVGLVEAVVAEAVSPHTVVERLPGVQILVDGKAPDVLNVWIDKRGEALVGVQPADAAARTVGIRDVLQEGRRRGAEAATGMIFRETAVR